MILLDQCKKGYLYKVNSRNLVYGVYDGDEGFIGIREKFGRKYLFTEYHRDGRRAGYGTVTPLSEIKALPDNIAPTELRTHEFGCDWCENPATGVVEPSIRRDLRDGETPHGRRQGFVDEWVSTRERIPDDKWPFLKSNPELFKWLADYENTPETETVVHEKV